MENSRANLKSSNEVGSFKFFSIAKCKMQRVVVLPNGKDLVIYFLTYVQCKLYGCNDVWAFFLEREIKPRRSEFT